ncbi:DNA topoisomerase 4 subunit B [Vibrio phage vB_VmeM-32]|nr:DNA topoisomerase 4 subunit B [Vibrio phage vB_VmeM-32]
MTENKKVNGDVFQILSERDHALQAPDMYIGSVVAEPIEVLIDGKYETLNYVPGLLKIIDEIIDNSVDEAIRTDYKFANEIRVQINNSCEVEISDNGRGIPQDDILTPEGIKIPRPLAAWTRARAGTNFDKGRTTMGKNGIGSALTNFFSSQFIGTTDDGKSRVIVRCTNSAENVDFVKEKSVSHGTSVKFVPDFDYFGVNRINENIERVIQNRLTYLAICHRQIKFYFNGKAISGNFVSFAKKFGDVYYENETNHSMFISTSDQFRHISFVNGIFTRLGGTHVDGITNAIFDELITLIKKKHKIDINRARIRENIMFGLFLRNFSDSKYDGQTKERLSNPFSQIKDHVGLDAVKIAKKILSIESIINPIIESALAKKRAADAAELKRKTKNALSINVPKHIKASALGKKKCSLFLTEGDSAIGYFVKARGDKSDVYGGFPLRGKILNVWDKTAKDAMKNAEISQLVSILNVALSDKSDPAYDEIVIMTDQDVDGKGSIALLLIALFYKFWPHWFDDERIKIIRTPEYISTNGKTVEWSYDLDEFKSKEKMFSKGKWEHRHIKGLGSLTLDEYKRCIHEPKFETIVVCDETRRYLEMLFGDDAEQRKAWLSGEF